MPGGGGAGNLVLKGGPFPIPVANVSIGGVTGTIPTVDHGRAMSSPRFGTGPDSRALRLHVFPVEDQGFRRFAESVLEAMLEDVAAGIDPAALAPAELQRRLRVGYPAAVVRERDSLADPGMGALVWYVYRYGSVAPARQWWEEPGHAWAILDDDRRFAEISSTLANIVEAPRDVLLGRPVEAFANPEDATAADDVAALWTELLVRGQLHATLRFRRMDGSPRELEYHVTKDGAGPGRHLAIVREIDPA
jgi:PAS domain-containing protein